MKNFFSVSIILLTLSQFFSATLEAQQTLTQIGGWNAYVHLPATYASSGKTYPTIIYFPAIAGVGTNASTVIADGPGAYIAQGWNGNITLDGNTVEFIVISLQPSGAFPLEPVMNAKLQLIKSAYRTDANRIYLTGYTHGGWCNSTFVTGDPLGGPYTYASQIAAVVNVEGQLPDDNQPYPALFDNFAKSGGRFLGFEQLYDGRDTRTIVDRMNTTVPNSAIYIQTNYGNGGNCCASQFFGGGGTAPGLFNLSGLSQTLYQWLARQSKTNSSNVPPVANAGSDKNVNLPVTTAVLNGSGSDVDGIITSFLWSQVAGPSAATMSNTAVPVLTVNDLMQGQYKFTLRVTDNTTAMSLDTVVVTVNPVNIPCNNNAPVTWLLNNTKPGEIYRPNGAAWKGGDTVKITGTSYTSIEFYNIIGDPCRPIVIMPLTTVTTPVFRLKGDCRYIKVWGGNTKYGIKINGTLGITSCHHIESNNIECTGGSVGIYCKQDVDYNDRTTWHPNYRMTKMTFRNMYVHDVPGEGMYIGITQPDGLVVKSTYSGLDTTILPVRLDSVEVSNCIVERTGWDGIQVSNARNGNKIFGNTVRNYGLLNVSTQQTGIILGSNCSGDIYGNSILKGTGNGIEAFGYGVTNIYNNILDSCGYDGKTNSNGSQGQQSIYASDYITLSDNNPKQTINAYGNAVNHPKTSGAIFITDYFNNSYPSAVYNNTFCIPGALPDWQATYLKSYVPGSTASNNILSCSAVPNVPPVAHAGNDITLTLPNNSTTLAGSGTDADGTIASYLWTKISGPATGILSNSATATASASGMVQGVYSYQLTVTDNAGATGKDTVKVTINPAVNQLPVVNAGNNIVLTLPSNTTNLSGSATDADGTISSYAWAKISGPSAGSLSNTTAATATASGLVQGVYGYQLTVTDNNGGIGKDTVFVTVNAAPNQIPLANAGNNITLTLPSNSTSLSGSGTDADGTINSYAWIKLSGPSAGTLSNATSAVASAAGLVQGVYGYQLIVTDNSGASAKDTVLVTVNAAANQAPIAHAGSDITLVLPTNSSNLTGSGTDADGVISSYLWTKISGPAAGTLSNATSATATAAGLAQGTYTYQLTVTDNAGAVGRDSIQIIVNSALNQAPIANAGNDLVIALPANGATLVGSGTDADGTITSYLWTKLSGPSAGTINNATSSTTTISGLAQGVYIYQLKVTDNTGATASDNVQVTVTPAANQAPSANAGNNILITLPVSSAILNGSGTDPDGSISSYLWSKISGPATGTIANAATASASLSGLTQGIYNYQLVVTDNSGATGKDTVMVTVGAAANQVPVANAGNDLVIALPANSATLVGSGTDADGTVTSYLWTKLSGPSAGTINNATSSTTTISGLAQGVYIYQLKVTDNTGTTASDNVQVTVTPAANQAPSANAGNNILITLPVSSAILNGSGTDPDGSISSYLWSKISGPATGTIANAASASASLSGLTQGIYNYQLVVTDNSGATGKDTVTVTVGAAANQAPVAHAGNDIVITLPVSSTILNGSGTDNDGTISAFAWIRISGPASGTLTNANSAAATASALIQGSYFYQLTVTDNSGATAKDTVKVTVNAAVPINQSPLAFAGNDITLTLPLNATTLTGSATDADGTISTYAWSKISGPAGTLSNNTSASATASGLVQGVYLYQLSVADNAGATGKDTVKVTVNAAISQNLKPIVNAGADITIYLPINTADLKGSASDPDGTIAAYKWTVLSGPVQYNFSNSANIESSFFGLRQGVYQVQLTVTDNSGATASDIVQVTVGNNRSAGSTGGGLKIYPNPVQTILTAEVTASKAYPNVKLMMYDLTGHLVYQKQLVVTDMSTQKIDMTQMVNGSYFLQAVYDDNSIITKKIIKIDYRVKVL